MIRGAGVRVTRSGTVHITATGGSTVKSVSVGAQRAGESGSSRLKLGLAEWVIFPAVGALVVAIISHYL